MRYINLRLNYLLFYLPAPPILTSAKKIVFVGVDPGCLGSCQPKICRRDQSIFTPSKKYHILSMKTVV